MDYEFHNRVGGLLRLSLTLITVVLCSFVIDAQNAQVKEIKIPAGQSADLWLGINVAGKLHYAIRSRDAKNKMRMWWVMEPLGNVKQLGSRSGSGELKIPGPLNGSLSAKLRGSVTSDTVLYISETTSVANSVAFNWP
jgi:hypothetical protein